MAETVEEYYPIELELKTVIDGKEYGLKYKNSSKYLDDELKCAKRAFGNLLKKLGKND